MNKKTIAGLVTAIAVAVASFFVTEVPVNEAVSIAMDKEKAIAACQELINGDAE